jgi:16S rRNA methyltransferase RsmB/F
MGVSSSGSASILMTEASSRGGVLWPGPRLKILNRRSTARSRRGLRCAVVAAVSISRCPAGLRALSARAIGALRRRPEARWRRSPESVAELGPLQRRLLATALDSVRRGGVVAYVTCSPHLAETRVVVDDVLKAHPTVERLDTPAVLTGIAPGLTGLGDGPYAQFWPHRHGTDAMFVALLRRG